MYSSSFYSNDMTSFITQTECFGANTLNFERIICLKLHQLPSLYVKGGKGHARISECASNFQRSLGANAMSTKVLWRPKDKRV